MSTKVTTRWQGLPRYPAQDRRLGPAFGGAGGRGLCSRQNFLQPKTEAEVSYFGKNRGEPEPLHSSIRLWLRLRLDEDAVRRDGNIFCSLSEENSLKTSDRSVMSLTRKMWTCRRLCGWLVRLGQLGRRQQRIRSSSIFRNSFESSCEVSPEVLGTPRTSMASAMLTDQMIPYCMMTIVDGGVGENRRRRPQPKNRQKIRYHKWPLIEGTPGPDFGAGSLPPAT